MLPFVDASGFLTLPDLTGEDEEEAELLTRLAAEAEGYVRSFEWCPPIERTYLAFGVGGIIGLFLFRFTRPIANGEDQELWVVVGDMPPAYFVTESAPNAPEALAAYCELMEDWAQAILSGGDVSECYPIAAAPTEEHARMLLSRLDTIRRDFIPMAGEGPTVRG